MGYCDHLNLDFRGNEHEGIREARQEALRILRSSGTSKRVDVGTRIDVFAFELLRGHVLHGPGERARVAERLLPCGLLGAAGNLRALSRVGHRSRRPGSGK